MAITFFGALFLELEFAIFAGVFLSLVLYLERVSKPRIVTRVPDPRLPKHAFSSASDLPQCPQLRFLRIDGSLFFGSVNHVEDAFARLEASHPEQKHLAIVAKGINFADLVGGDALVKEAKRRKARSGDLYLVDVKQGLWESLEQCECIDGVGGKNVFHSKKVAITAIFQKLDKSICSTCSARIFRECATVKKVEN
jgi:SulP family sulfate permease